MQRKKTLMKRLKIFDAVLLAATLAAPMSFAAPRAVQAQELAPAIRALIEEFRGESAARLRTPQQLEAAYAQVFNALLPDMKSGDAGRRGGALETWKSIGFRVARPGAEAERATFARMTATRLGPQPGLSQDARAELVELLERIGKAEVVPMLTRLLDGNELLLREAARRALQNNPSAEAGQTLRLALERGGADEWRVGLINALGYRAETASVAALARLLGAQAAAPVAAAPAVPLSTAVAEAAVAALGKIGGAEAVTTLQALKATAAPAIRAAVVDALLHAAENLLRGGQTREAETIYNELYAPAESRLVRIAALRGLVAARGQGATPLLAEVLTGDDLSLQTAAIRFAGEIPGVETTKAFASLLPRLASAAQATLLGELANRGDVAARPAVLEAAKSASAEVRIAALRALSRVGDASDALLLARVSATGDKREAEAAHESLARLSAAGANAALLRALPAADSRLRLALIRGLAARRAMVAAPALLQVVGGAPAGGAPVGSAKGNADAAVRLEAVRALGVLGDERSAPALIGFLTRTTNDEAREAAVKSLGAIYGRQRNRDAQPIVAALAKAGVPARVALLGVLRQIGTPQALDSVRGARRDADADVRDAAVRALADWPNDATLDDLIAIARGNNEKLTHQVLALRGYVRLAGAGERAAGDRVQMLQTALQAATRPEEKKLVLGALGEVKSVEALSATQPFLADEALREEAAAAVVKIAGELEDVPASVLRPVLMQVAEVSKNADVTKNAGQISARFDDQANHGWLLSGPFPAETQEQINGAYPPEQGIDLQAAYDTVVGGKKYVARWQEVSAREHKVDFNKFYPPSAGNTVENAFAYALSYVFSPIERKVKLAVGSDDGVRIWLNDVVIHNNRVQRAAQLDQDIVDATLRAGWNKVLLRIENRGADWQFFFRIADEKLLPLPDLKWAVRPAAQAPEQPPAQP